MTFWEKARDVGYTLLIFSLVGVIVWVVISYGTGRSTSNEDILTAIREQSCILSLQPEHRTAEAQARCREEALAREG